MKKVLYPISIAAILGIIIFVVASGQVITNSSGGGSLTAPATLNNNGIAAIPTNSFILSNSTAAAAGAQQYSPSLSFIGQGWKTTATAASQTVEWDAYVIPLQGAANPSAGLNFWPIVNGVRGAGLAFLNIGATSTGVTLVLDGLQNPANSTSSGLGAVNSGGAFGSFISSAIVNNWNANGLTFTNTSGLMWASASAGNSITGDVTLDRDAVGVLGVQSGAPGTTAANYRDLHLRNLTHVPQTFASLATCAAGTEGQISAISDSSTVTWGATITGSSTNHVLGYCDGTNWTVMGK